MGEAVIVSAARTVAGKAPRGPLNGTRPTLWPPRSRLWPSAPGLDPSAMRKVTSSIGSALA